MGLIIKNINMAGKFRGTFPQVPPPPPAPSDQYAAYTVLNLAGTGTNNTNNNVFRDSSANNYTVTRLGNSTQGSFNPFYLSDGYWSVAFDGSGDQLTTPSNAAFRIDQGNWTWEGWVYPNLTSIKNTVISIGAPRSSTYYAFYIGSTNGGMLFTTNSGTWSWANEYYSNTGVIIANQWNHFAIVRNGNSLTFYANGVAAGTVATANFGSGIGGTVYIGSYYADANSDGSWFNGFISNLRFVKGTALYSGSTYTVPTGPLTVISNTSLLVCQSNSFKDSTGVFTLTPFSNARVSTFTPFTVTSTYSTATMGGSMYFDGTGDYLTAGATSNFKFLHDTNALFTIEAWIYSSGFSPSGPSFGTGFASAQVGTAFWVNPSGQLRLLIGRGVGGTAIVDVTSTGVVRTNSWIHIAVTYNQSLASNNGTFYINGVAAGTFNKTTNVPSTANSSYPFTVNASETTSAAAGYISGLRVTNSIVYTGNFTPPALPPTAITGTQLLLNGTNGSIFDSSASTNLETLGDAKVSTTISSNGSMYFDGSGDYLFMPANLTLALTSGAFTMEAWIYPTNFSGTERQIICQDDGNGNNQNFQFKVNMAGKLNLVYWTTSIRSSAVTVSSTNSISLNAWSHVAVSYTGSTLRLFINGIQEFSGSVSSMYSNTVGTSTTIGSLRNITYSNYFSGYMNDVRITKGIARYTANFTPPTRS